MYNTIELHDICDREEVAQYFNFLDDLRDSGDVNMLGARPVLADAYGLDRKTSSAVHAAWMKSYDGKTSLENRVAAFFA